MKKYIVCSLVLALSGCTVLSEPEEKSLVEGDDNGVYCSVTTPTGKVIFTNEDARQFTLQSGEPPTCDLLYAAIYDHGAPTAYTRAQQLELKIKQLEAHVEALEGDIKAEKEITEKKIQELREQKAHLSEQGA